MKQRKYSLLVGSFVVLGNKLCASWLRTSASSAHRSQVAWPSTSSALHLFHHALECFHLSLL